MNPAKNELRSAKSWNDETGFDLLPV